MFYELRSYHIDPARWDEFVAWGDKLAVPALVDHCGFRLMGSWEVLPAAGEAALPINYRFMLAWESEEEMRERWAAAWAAAVDPTTSQPKYHLQGHSILTRPLAHSPLQ